MGPVPMIDGFDDLQALGRGGFSTVYSATQADLGRRVAIKVLDLDLEATPGVSQRRFERECKVVGILSGVPGIVSVHRSAFTADGRPCIVMELMEGGSLDQFVKDNGLLSAEDAVRLAEVLSSALAAAHGRGVVHRDIKPGNVLLSGDGKVALADFGIAMVAHLVSSTQTIDSISPPYSPPERLMSGEPDEQLADLYSLGATLYFGLTGGAPFGTARDGGVSGLVFRVMNDPLPPIHRPDVPPEFVDLVTELLDRRPDRRPTSATEVHRRVAEILASMPTSSAASGRPSATPGPSAVEQPVAEASRPTPPASTGTGSEPLPPPLDPALESIEIPAPPSAGQVAVPLPMSEQPYVEPQPDEGGPLWPTPVDYARAIQDPATLLEPRLQLATLQRDLLGMPVSAAGQSAVVFHVTSERSDAAVRFFTRPPQGSRRYDALARHLESHPCPSLVPAEWLSEAMVIDEVVRPAVWMPWLPGRPLNLAVEDLLADPVRLEALAGEFLAVVVELQTAGVAHGDLQNGNILVDDDLSVRLVDLDGVWVPSLSGSPPNETGHRCFQHPRRTVDDWGPGIDTFSAVLIFTSLLALSVDPELWTHHQGENLILTPDDLRYAGDTPVWDALMASNSPRVRSLAALLAEQSRAAGPPIAVVDELVQRHSPPDETTARRTSSAPPGVGARGVDAGPVAQPLIQPAGDGWWQSESDCEVEEPDRSADPGSAPAPTTAVPLIGGASMLARLGNGPGGVGLASGVAAALVAVGVHQWVAIVEASAQRGSSRSTTEFAAALALMAAVAVLAALHRSWQDITGRAWNAGARRAGTGLLAGAGWALAAVLLLDGLASLVDGASGIAPAQTALALYLVGSAAGAAAGTPTQARGWLAGIVGGASAGAVMGLLVGAAAESGSITVSSSGAVRLSGSALTLLALALVVISLSVALARFAAARAKVTVMSGPLRNRRVAIHNPRFRIGAGVRDDLVVACDERLGEASATLLVGAHEVELSGPGAVLLGGSPIADPALVGDGDRFQVGATSFALSVRG